MDTISLHSDPDKIPTWEGVTSYLVNGMQPVFVQLPQGDWINTRLIDSVTKQGCALVIDIGGELVSIPDAAKFWGTQTTTPGR